MPFQLVYRLNQKYTESHAVPARGWLVPWRPTLNVEPHFASKKLKLYGEERHAVVVSSAIGRELARYCEPYAEELRGYIFDINEVYLAFRQEVERLENGKPLRYQGQIVFEIEVFDNTYYAPGSQHSLIESFGLLEKKGDHFEFTLAPPVHEGDYYAAEAMAKGEDREGIAYLVARAFVAALEPLVESKRVVVKTSARALEEFARMVDRVEFEGPKVTLIDILGRYDFVPLDGKTPPCDLGKAGYVLVNPAAQQHLGAGKPEEES